MALSQRDIAEARKVYETYWETYFTGNMEGFTATIDEEFSIIGTSEGEIGFGKDDVVAIYQAQFDEVVGRAERRNREVREIPTGNMLQILEFCDIYVLTDAQWNFYSKFRLSTLLRQNPDGWKLLQQHGSLPDMRVGEGETVAIDKISKENLELRDAVKRRTAELEAKNRDLAIEAALEKVRSRSLAMQKSDELREVIQVVYAQFAQLGIHVDHTGFIIDYPSNDDMHIWLADRNGVPSEIRIPYFDAPHWNSFVEAKKNGDDFFVNRHSFEEKNKFYHTLFELIPGLSDKTKTYYLECPGLDISTVLMDNVGLYIERFSGTPYTNADNQTLKRFGKVFQQAYTRFLDLQKAEAQTREALIETALEKVRSRTMAMQSGNELQQTAAVLFQEFKKLGADDMQQFTIGIYNEEERVIDFRVTSWAGGGEQENRSFQLDMEEPTLVKPAVAAWKAGKKSAMFDLTGDALQGWLNYRNKISGSTINTQDTGGRRVITAAYFSKGHLTISTLVPLQPETIKTLERFATVFDGTYTRFLDLEKAEAQARQAEQDLIAIKDAKQKAEEALAELQVTQKQLIQSEKMASLGELTAGIAHEIQNPLNFVNNFSEVSNELIDEMQEELDKGDVKEAKSISSDIKQNLEKIAHHGKRADAIVKGMLAHSRSGKGEKAPTDINALAEEYLKLSYHGLRAKDKSFNADFKTDFDPDLPKVNVVPQDIGRVLLNLINNAFQACTGKDLTGFKNLSNLAPLVTVSTRNLGNKIEISVKDNGPGIPDAIKDKIFQPFFTTKPTGQGTGLGLSLSYDIVQAHGGEIKVNTKENDGTEFTIQLPI
jgi:signal transduction histidine kinase